MYRIEAATIDRMDVVRGLFREYQQSLGIDLCFQNFERKLAELPGCYATPRGEILLAVAEDVAGCVALRPLSSEIAEMKRLYIRPDQRGTGLGRILAAAIIQAARDRSYRAIRLDTLPQMQTAIGMYRRLGFVEIEPYTVNPVPGILYMELAL